MEELLEGETKPKQKGEEVLNVRFPYAPQAFYP